MMPIHITLDALAEKAARFLLNRQNLTEERRVQILPATKYNLLIRGFNVSSILLVAAAVFALFFSFITSGVFLAFGLFLRTIAQKEIHKYSVPSNQRSNVQEFWRYFTWAAAEDETARNIFENVRLPKPEGWVCDEIIFADFVLWKNKIPIPEAPAGRASGFFRS